MVAINGNNPSQSSLAQLLQSLTSSSSASGGTTSDATANGTRGRDTPATNITLSNKAKAIIARAQADQAVVDRLQQAIDQANGKSPSNRQSQSSGSDPGKIYQQVSAKGSPATASSLTANSSFVPGEIQPAISFSNSLTTASSQTGDSSFAPGEIKPASSFSKSLQAYGLSISVDAAKNGGSTVTITGANGAQFIDKVSAVGGGFAGGGLGGGLLGGVSVQNNTETFTFYSNSATAENAAASSNGETVSASAVSAQSKSITIAVNFSTGTIAAEQSEQSVSARTNAIAMG